MTDCYMIMIMGQKGNFYRDSTALCSNVPLIEVLSSVSIKWKRGLQPQHLGVCVSDESSYTIPPHGRPPAPPQTVRKKVWFSGVC